MEVIYWIIGMFLYLAIISEFSRYCAFGWMIDKNELNRFMRRNMGKYSLNVYSSQNNLFHATELPFISRIGWGIFSNWHVDGYGSIPRWSQWHKELNNLRKNSKIYKPKKSLSKYY